MPSLQFPSLGEQGLRDRKINLNDDVVESAGSGSLGVDELRVNPNVTRTFSDSQATESEQGCGDDVLERRMSLNSSSAMKDLQDLAGRCTLESTWVRAMLLSTGGLRGGEQLAMKFSRRSFLQSGLLQWLVHSTKHKDLLVRFDIACRSLFLGTAVEGMALNIIACLVVLHENVGTGRFNAIYGSAQWLFCVLGLVNAVLHFVSVLIAKQLPMFLGLICDVLVADLRQFHHTIDVLFRNRERMSEACLLEELQNHECSLRIRLASSNKILLQMVLVILLTNAAELLGCLLLFVSSLFIRTHAGIAAIMLFLVLQHSLWLLSALRNIARVGDEWHHIVEEFNTPRLCSATANVLGGISLDDRLGRLRYMGITVLEYTITSSTVASVMFTISSGLFLTALGIILQIQFE